MVKKWNFRGNNQLQHFVDFIGQQLLAGKNPTVEIIPEKRSIPQNSISHAWYAEIAKQKEDISPLDAKCISKLHCGVALLMSEDDVFRDRWERLIKDRYSYEEKIEMMEMDLPVTSLMNKAQLSTYLERMQSFWSKQGIYLHFPEDYQRAKYPESG